MEQATDRAARFGEPHARHDSFLRTFVMVTTLAAVVMLSLTAWSIFIPAVGICALLGLAIATLTSGILHAGSNDSFRGFGFRLGGATVAVLAFVYFTNGWLDEQMGRLRQIEQLVVEKRAAEAKALAAEERSNRQRILQRRVVEPIVGGARVRLEDVNTLNGWNEGTHADNKEFADAEFVFESLFDILDIRFPVGKVLAMDEAEWKAFLARLPAGKRLQLGGIPFARLTIVSSDRRAEQRTAFRDAIIPVLNRKGDAEAYICIRRILDVRERRSGEPEIIVIANSRERCDGAA